MLIIGLGNPGKEYKNTRHNVGHMVVDHLEKKKPDNFALAKTETFMNKSGLAVKKLIRNRKMGIENLIVIHDDIDLPIGQFKIQKNRGAAGHKGVQSIINELGTKDFWRVRIGICPEGKKPENVEKFVLQKFRKGEEEIIKEEIGEIAEKIKREI